MNASQYYQCPEPVDLLEFFSGMARVSKMGALFGLQARSVDIDYDTPPRKKSKHSKKRQRSAMDINGEAGFTLPGHHNLGQCFKFGVF